MTQQPFSSAEKVRAHADVMELEEIDFCDANGTRTKDRKALSEVHLKFIDATIFRLTVAEFNKLSDYKFKLRPTQDNA